MSSWWRKRVGKPWTRAAVVVACVLGAASCQGEEPEQPLESSREGRSTEPAPTDRVLEGVWSPDGRRLAVTWDRGTGPRLYGLLAGTDSTPAESGRGLPLSSGRAAWPSWSPDGFWIVYEAGGDIHRMRPDGTGEEPLTRRPTADSHPAYAPDGTRIVFVSDPGEDGPPALWLMQADGSDPRPVPMDVERFVRAPVWHPSGGLLAVEVVHPEGSAVYRVDPEEGSAERLAMGESPAFGPSGDTLYYARNDSVFRRSWPGAGAISEELVVTPGRTPRPAPDGLRLAFVRGDRPGGVLYLLHLDAGTVRRVTSTPPERP